MTQWLAVAPAFNGAIRWGAATRATCGAGTLFACDAVLVAEAATSELDQRADRLGAILERTGLLMLGRVRFSTKFSRLKIRLKLDDIFAPPNFPRRWILAEANALLSGKEKFRINIVMRRDR